MKVRTHDTQSLARILDEGICSIESVRETRTTIVLDTALEGGTALAAALGLETGAASRPRKARR